MKHNHYLIGKAVAKEREKLRGKCLDLIIVAIKKWQKSTRTVEETDSCVADIEEYISDMEFELEYNHL